jgi:hypothetical protein
MPSEALTIQIQGDSSSLAASLDDALSRIQSLQSSAEAAGASAEGIGGRLGGVSAALAPLNQVGQALTRISQQAAAIGQQPININVQPALASLQSLLSMIQSVAAQLQALSNPVSGFSNPGSGPTASPSSGSPRASNSSMTVSGPARTSSVQSSLALPSPQVYRSAATSTSGPLSFVAGPSQFNSSVERQLTQRESRTITLPASEPAAIADRSLNRTTSEKAEPPTLPFQSAETPPVTERSMSSSVTNHFGGITIAVRETADVNSLMRDLRLQGLSLRHRQG